MKNNRLNKFSASALFTALAIILSYIKIFHLPFGGSITLFSMLVISLPAYFFGISYGFMASFAYSLLQLILDPYIVHPLQVLLDYIIAFSCFGVVGCFRKMKNGLVIGFIAACIIRFLSSSISGYVFFSEYTPEGWTPIYYTVLYNASYVFTECICSIVLIQLPPVSKFIESYYRKLL